MVKMPDDWEGTISAVVQKILLWDIGHSKETSDCQEFLAKHISPADMRDAITRDGRGVTEAKNVGEGPARPLRFYEYTHGMDWESASISAQRMSPVALSGAVAPSANSGEDLADADRMELSAEQLAIVAHENPTFIQGRGGTGKTTTLVGFFFFV